MQAGKFLIIDADGKSLPEATAIARYFRNGETVREFHAQIQALDPESKTELAIGAAKELGLRVV